MFHLRRTSTQHGWAWICNAAVIIEYSRHHGTSYIFSHPYASETRVPPRHTWSGIVCHLGIPEHRVNFVSTDSSFSSNLEDCFGPWSTHQQTTVGYGRSRYILGARNGVNLRRCIMSLVHVDVNELQSAKSTGTGEVAEYKYVR
jgi:hypothetical protein